MTGDEFVRLRVFDVETDALNAKAILEENGIEVKISGLEPSALGISLEGGDAIDLYVRQSQAQRAGELIDEVEEEEELAIPGWTCKCGEDVDEGFFVCWSCGAQYDQQAEA